MVTKIGLIQVYTGDGKGKTTAALGQALRAFGHGWRVAIFQFLKGGGATGELKAAARLGPDFALTQCGTGEFIINRPPTPEEIRLAGEGLDQACAALSSGRVDLVILDEVAAAIDLGLLDADAVLTAVKSRAAGVEVILTGRGMPPAVLAAADLISEIRAVRHPYERGLGAREGIEF